MALMVEIDYIRSFHKTNRFTLMNFIRSRLTLNVKLLLMILNQGWHWLGHNSGTSWLSGQWCCVSRCSEASTLHCWFPKQRSYFCTVTDGTAWIFLTPYALAWFEPTVELHRTGTFEGCSTDLACSEACFLSLFISSLNSSALDHSATAPPISSVDFFTLHPICA